MRKPPEPPSGNSVGQDARPSPSNVTFPEMAAHKPASADHPEHLADPIERLPARPSGAGLKLLVFPDAHAEFPCFNDAREVAKDVASA